jgi:hypothetical protein
MTANRAEGLISTVKDGAMTTAPTAEVEILHGFPPLHL